MRRSRTTLASTEAAATEAQLASPSTIGRTRPGEGLFGMAQQVDRAVDEEGVRDRSPARQGPGGPPPARPRSCPTRRTPPGLACPTAQAGTTRRRRRRSPHGGPRSASWSRAARPAWSAAGPVGRTTATPTVSGPAQAPRPTSSSPATHSKPCARRRRSSLRGRACRRSSDHRRAASHTMGA